MTATRPSIDVYLAVSLDGYIARDDGAIDWLTEIPPLDGEDYGYAAFMASIDAVVMGRATWDTVAHFDPWPYAGKRMVVLTSRALTALHGEETWNGPLLPLFEKLMTEGVSRVYLDGGVAVQQALRDDLVDTLTLTVVPRVLGSGRPLFVRGLPDRGWKLLDARPFASGLAQLRYAR